MDDTNEFYKVHFCQPWIWHNNSGGQYKNQDIPSLFVVQHVQVDEENVFIITIKNIKPQIYVDCGRHQSEDIN